MSSNLKVNSLVPATGTEIGIGTTGGTIDFRCPATFGGNVTIGGTLTYDEVINIDSIGIVTARSGLKVTGGQLDVGSNIKLGNAGVVTATGANITGQTTIAHTGSPQLILKDSDSNSPNDANGISLRAANNTEYGFIGQSDTGGHVLFIKTVATTNPIRLQVNSTTRLEVANTGCFVTGTFDVASGGTSSLRGDVYIPDKLRHISDDDTAIRFPANDTISFETAGDERLRITSAGKVGIGTDLPQEELTIRSSTPALMLRDTDQEGSYTQVSNANQDMYFSANGTSAHANFIFRSGNAGSFLERLRITSDGKLNTKGSASSVTAGCQSGGIHLVHANAEGTPTFTGGEVAIFQRNYNSSQGCHIGIIGGSVSNADINFGDKDDADAGKIRYDNNQNAFRFYTNSSGTEKVRIDSNGRVLIGNSTVTGAATLQVQQSSGDMVMVRNHATNYEGLILSVASGEARILGSSGGSTARPDITFYAGDSEQARLTAGGAMGVGTTTPDRKLDVSGTGNVYGKFQSTNATGAGIEVKDTAERWLIQADGGVGPGLAFYDLGRTAYRMHITSSQIELKPPGNSVCDLAFKLNNSNDSRIKFYDSGGTQRGAFCFTEYSNSTAYPNLHDSFYMQTDPGSNGSVEVCARVNREGIWILPKQPCFSVRMSSDYTSSSTHTANFNTERFDQGNNFNTGSNGIFTAPVTGKYYMHVAIQTRSGGDNQDHIMGVSFLVNGAVTNTKGTGDQYWGRDSTHYMSVHNTRILNLAQGDTVQVRIQLHGSVNIEGSGGTDRCNWQGYLIG